MSNRLPQEVTFGRFRLVASQRLLTRNGEPVRIGSRALAILLALVERAGEFVSKEDLAAAVWPGLHVDETNVRTQVAALRRALAEDEDGSGYVIGIAGQGYRFAAPLVSEPITASTEPDGDPIPLPSQIEAIIGRSDEITNLMAMVRRERLVTIAGAGGVGKTTVGIAVARQLAERNGLEACYADLNALADGTFIVGSVAAAAGLPSDLAGTVEGVGRLLRGRKLLLLLDGCETFIDAAASIAEAILRETAEVRILATSREPLRAEGETAFRLPSLDLPPLPDGSEGPADPLRYAAVQLFVERARAADDRLVVDQVALDQIVEICRHLEGIPLAIELAATRVADLGLPELANRLDSRFADLLRGRRTALPRHQTLKATLDWSYRLLTDRQQRLLCRLAVFRAGFGMEAAIAVGRSEEVSPNDVVDDVADLTAKSLIHRDGTGQASFFRLPNTARAYLLQNLASHGETDDAMRACAAYLVDLLERGAAGWEKDHDVRQRVFRHLDTIRACLDWTFGPHGDRRLGIALAVAATLVWGDRLLFEETRGWIGKALAASEDEANAPVQLKLRLIVTLAMTSLDLGLPDQEELWRRALSLAETDGDTRMHMRAVNGLVLSLMSRDHGQALLTARDYRGSAERSPDIGDRAEVEQLIGFVLHATGARREARRQLEAMLTRHPPPAERRASGQFYFDPWIVARATLALGLWLEGEFEEGENLGRDALREAMDLGHTASIFFAAAHCVCPIAALSGTLGREGRTIALLMDPRTQTRTRGRWGACYQGMRMMETGATHDGLARLRGAMAELGPGSFGKRYPLFHAAVGQGLLALDMPDAALPVVNAALDATRVRGENWCEAELLRVRAETHRRSGDRQQAERDFRDAIARAGEQGAAGLARRAATGLNDLLRSGEAPDIMANPGNGRSLPYHAG